MYVFVIRKSLSCQQYLRLSALRIQSKVAFLMLEHRRVHPDGLEVFFKTVKWSRQPLRRYLYSERVKGV